MIIKKKMLGAFWIFETLSFQHLPAACCSLSRVIKWWKFILVKLYVFPTHVALFNLLSAANRMYGSSKLNKRLQIRLFLSIKHDR